MRRPPNHQNFVGVHQNLAEHGSFTATTRQEHPYSKRVCCICGQKSSYQCALQPENPEQPSIVLHRAKPYVFFIYKECSCYSQMIIHDAARMHNSFLTKVRQTCILVKKVCTRPFGLTFPNTWIGRYDSVAWPPQSPDLSPIIYFFERNQ